MLKEVDGYYVAAQIRLLRQVRKGTILVLEGNNDARVFTRFIDKEVCDVEVAFGKLNVCEAIDLLEEEGFSGVVGVIDADFDRLTGATYNLTNLCITDAHDLDLTIFLSSALEGYLLEHGDQTRIEVQFKDLAAVRARIIESCVPLACCRLASQYRNLRLNFRGIRHEDLVNKDTLTMDQGSIIAAVLSHSGEHCAPDILAKYISIEISKAHNPYQLTSGHDAAAVLGIALRKVLGDRRDVHTWAREIESGLRLAFDWEALTETCLYQCLRSWERENAPYRIFRH